MLASMASIPWDMRPGIILESQDETTFASHYLISANSGSDTEETCWPIEAGSRCWDAF